ncbi:MAG: amino terminal protease family [Paenibacillaceae bacterium]|jgi:membrane protease YdiL (CAAX protease family)|nr:amino terminal protease family [Paenibacillaceae bacterium]
MDYETEMELAPDMSLKNPFSSLSDISPKTRDWIILIVFFLFVGPGPAMFILNKYTISLFPLCSFVFVVWLLRKDIASASFDALLKNRATYSYAFFALKYSIFAHAITTIALKPPIDLPERDLLGTYVIFAFYMIVIGPIMEELAYRKVIFGFLNNKFGFWAAAIVSSVIFAAAHFSWQRAPAYFAVGMLLCHVYRKSGSLTPAIMAHMSLNFISILVSTLRG